jgi:hypothetical protein
LYGIISPIFTNVIYWLDSGSFSQGAGTLGTERDIVFSQLVVEELSSMVE